MAESFDAVLAEMRAIAEADGCATDWRLRDWADRLQAAHEAEVAERDRALLGLRSQRLIELAGKNTGIEQERIRADRAVGLLRECLPYMPFKGLPATVTARVRAFLSEQAGERENVTKESAHED